MAAENARGKKHPLTKAQVIEIQQWLTREHRWRDLALFMLGIDTLLRSVELLKLRYGAVCDVHGHIKPSIIRGQQKNKRTVECYLSEPTQEAVRHWIKVSNKGQGDYLFTRLRCRKDFQDNSPISRGNFALLIKQWVAAIGLDPDHYSTRTLRRSRVRPILEKANLDYQIPRLLLGHADIRSTIHYCAVDQQQAEDIARSVEFFVPLNLTPNSKE